MTPHAHSPSDAASPPSDELLRERLRAAGQRVTAARLAVARALGASRAALDAAQVLAQVGHDRADRVSVYRALNMLVEAGIAHRIDAGDRVFRYSLTDHSACTAHHHNHDHPHIVCETCGSVECLTGAEVVIRPPASGAARLSAQRFRIKAQEVTLRGVCEACDRASGTRSKAKAQARAHDRAKPKG